MTEPAELLRLTSLALAMWSALTGLHLLAEGRVWQTGQALGWDLLGLRRSRVYGSALLEWIFARLSVAELGLALLALAIGLALVPVGAATPILLALLLVATALLALRTIADGAAKIALISAGGVLLMSLGLLLALPKLVLAGVLWSGGQLTLSYCTTGLAKLAIPAWRDGSALREALSSYQWGERRVAALLTRRGVALIAAWAVILLEAVFPLALFAPAGVLAAALVAMFALHLAIAAVMGINTYPWAFLSTYPAVWALGGLARGFV
jgi:hypothetical protein